MMATFSCTKHDLCWFGGQCVSTGNNASTGYASMGIGSEVFPLSMDVPEVCLCAGDMRHDLTFYYSPDCSRPWWGYLVLLILSAVLLAGAVVLLGKEASMGWDEKHRFKPIKWIYASALVTCSVFFFYALSVWLQDGMREAGTFFVGAAVTWSGIWGALFTHTILGTMRKVAKLRWTFQPRQVVGQYAFVLVLLGVVTIATMITAHMNVSQRNASAAAMMLYICFTMTFIATSLVMAVSRLEQEIAKLHNNVNAAGIPEVIRDDKYAVVLRRLRMFKLAVGSSSAGIAVVYFVCAIVGLAVGAVPFHWLIEGSTCAAAIPIISLITRLGMPPSSMRTSSGDSDHHHEHEDSRLRSLNRAANGHSLSRPASSVLTPKGSKTGTSMMVESAVASVGTSSADPGTDAGGSVVVSPTASPGPPSPTQARRVFP